MFLEEEKILISKSARKDTIKGRGFGDLCVRIQELEAAVILSFGQNKEIIRAGSSLYCLRELTTEVRLARGNWTV